MTPNTDEPRGAIGEWEVGELVDRLTDDEAEDGEVVRLEGLTSSAVRDRLAEIGDRLEDRGKLTLCFDPGDAERGCTTLRELVAEYAREVQKRRGLGETSDQLVEFLASARDASAVPFDESLTEQAYKNTICRLWRRLAEEMPAVVFAFNLRDCSSTERGVLEHLVMEFLADPVADFVPELAQQGRFQSTIVLVEGTSETTLDIPDEYVEKFDVSTPVRESLREVLSSDNVVDQFLASTGGDPRQLEALLSSLPSDCENFWQYRYQRLDEASQTVIELLGVARDPLSIECLRQAGKLVEPELDFSTTVRELTDEGFVDRRIDAGTVRLQLADGEFRRALASNLREGRARGLHLALAEAALGAQLDVVGDRFLARHFLKAGEVDRGFEYGMRAGRRLHGEHSLREARELFDTLLEHADQHANIREIRHYLVDTEEALGNFETALEHVRALVEISDDELDWARLKCKRAELYVQTGEYERGEEIYESLVDDGESAPAPEIRAAALYGHGESQYLQGNHVEAESLVDRAVDVLEDETLEQQGGIEFERTLVKARNLRGKLALYRGELDAAEPMFATNYRLADQRGFEREATRAELNQAVVDLQRGNYAAALETLDDLRTRTPGPEGTQRAALMINLGMAAQQEDEYGDALEHYRAALREAKRADYQEAVSMAAYNLATALLELGSYRRLFAILDRLEEEKVAGQNLFMGKLPGALRVKALIEQEQPGEALEVLEQLEVGEDDRVAAGARADALLSSASAHAQLGQIEQARSILEGFTPPDEATTHYCLEGDEAAARAAVYLREEDYERAAEMAREAGQAFQEAGYNTDFMRAVVTRVNALRELGRQAEALSIVERRLGAFQKRAEKIPEDLRDNYYQIPAFQNLVRLNRELGGDDTTRIGAPEAGEKAAGTSLDEPRDERLAFDGGEPLERGDRSSESFRRWRRKYADIIGEDDRLLKIFRRIDHVATSDSPVLIQGESGTGKELIAEAVHRQASEGDESFVKVNCGAFVDNLLLSELFGHEKGAFTGAVEQKVGRFERADDGTIFLDEIGEMSQKAQVALLRVLQEGEFERVGGTETRSVDVRIICATNRDLEEMVERGEFRLDLYYRLKGVLLELPPLRERKQDIPRLVRHFAAEHSADSDPEVEFERQVLEFLASYSWPGNIRELKNFVRSILLFVDGHRVTMEHLRGFRDFFSEGEVALEAPEIDYDVPIGDFESDEDDPATIVDDPEEALVEEIVDDGLDLAELKERIEHQSIRRALEETGGNITRAAEILQMTRPRLSQIVNSDESLVELKEQLVG
jgi:DNA-binding NtrC family response regulator